MTIHVCIDDSDFMCAHQRETTKPNPPMDHGEVLKLLYIDSYNAKPYLATQKPDSPSKTARPWIAILLNCHYLDTPTMPIVPGIDEVSPSSAHIDKSDSQDTFVRQPLLVSCVLSTCVMKHSVS